jgi:prefoldin subunit 5
MSAFVPLDIETYKKTYPPVDEQSRVEYLDQQLRSIERAINHLTRATQQLQDEQALIWSALNALGQVRP